MSDAFRITDRFSIAGRGVVYNGVLGGTEQEGL